MVSMIDVHSHIIPGIDDGARTMEMALDMARQTVDAGVTHLVCTPHMHWGTFDNTKPVIKQGFDELVNEVDKAGIKLALSWAGEIRINEMVPIWLIFKRRLLHAFFWSASSTRPILVASKSSPTNSTGQFLLNSVQAAQSS